MTTHAAHWGVFTAEAAEGEVTAITPWSGDAAPSPLLGNIPGSVRHRSRVARPAVRRGWLEHGPGPTDRRGHDDWVQPPWDEVLDAVAAELQRVRTEHGNEAIYGGSYGWASAGRFHHAQSQLHRFLNCLGGYTRSVNSYSTGASEVILPHIIAPESTLTQFATTWDVLADHTELFVCFGGVPVKNTGIDSGGTAAHPTPGALTELRRRGCRLIDIGPLRDDLDGASTWLPVRPGSDIALMLALCFVLDSQGLADLDFLDTYCVGAGRFLAYVRGDTDGTPKTPQWAQALCEIDAETIDDLARDMAGHRTMINVTWSLQRARHGEHALWAALALAAMLGQIGLPGGGYSNGYGSMNKPGLSPTAFRLPSLPQGNNSVTTFIPVARISDMLLHPGDEFAYNGGAFNYPDIRLVHWAGGNPFHHHQDLRRLTRAFGRPDTVIVHDPYWTTLARHADIVFPSTTTLERDDIAGTRAGARLTAMEQVVPRHAQARDDYDIFCDLSRRLGVEAEFSEGRDAEQWITHLYDEWRADLRHGRIQPRAEEPIELPDLAQVRVAGGLDLPTVGPVVAFADFRADPQGHPLSTPSGRIELFSEVIDGFDLTDCPPHPTWQPPQEWLGGERATRFPLHLIANQPRTRLHSQLDHGATSQAAKVAGREPIRMHPDDARDRGIADGDVVRVFTDLGACLAGAVLSDSPRQGVVQLSTGAWYDPYDPGRHGPADLQPGDCVHGNPNVLTADIGTSTLAQACTGQHVLVQIERYDGPLPPVLAFDPPVSAG